MRASDTCNFCKLLITDRSITHKVNRSEDSDNCSTYIWDNDMRSFKAYFFILIMYALVAAGMILIAKDLHAVKNAIRVTRKSRSYIKNLKKTLHGFSAN